LVLKNWGDAIGLIGPKMGLPSSARRMAHADTDADTCQHCALNNMFCFTKISHLPAKAHCLSAHNHLLSSPAGASCWYSRIAMNYLWPLGATNLTDDFYLFGFASAFEYALPGWI